MQIVTPSPLAPVEQRVLALVGKGQELRDIALGLQVPECVAREHLRVARGRLGTGETAFAVAAAYALNAIERPRPRHVRPAVTSRQYALVPLVAQGLDADQMAAKLHRPAASVRRDGRALMTGLNARTPVHLVTRAWQHRLLTEGQVRQWLP